MHQFNNEEVDIIVM